MATTSPLRSSGAIASTIASASSNSRAGLPWALQVGDHGSRVKTFALRNRFRLEHIGENHLIGDCQALREFMLKHGPPQRVRRSSSTAQMRRPG